MGNEWRVSRVACARMKQYNGIILEQWMEIFFRGKIVSTQSFLRSTIETIKQAWIYKKIQDISSLV